MSDWDYGCSHLLLWMYLEDRRANNVKMIILDLHACSEIGLAPSEIHLRHHHKRIKTRPK
jgi:hypothetical protein